MSEYIQSNELNWRMCSKPVSKNQGDISKDKLNWRNFSCPIVYPSLKKVNSKKQSQIEESSEVNASTQIVQSTKIQQPNNVDESNDIEELTENLVELSVLEHSKTKSEICSEVIKLPDNLIYHSWNGK